MSDESSEVVSIDALAAEVIHTVRAVGIVPAAMGSAVQWTIVTRALLEAGWTPPPTVLWLGHRDP